MKRVYVPMWTFYIGKRGDYEIVSPGAQTCLVLLLKSKTEIAVAHIDSPWVALEITRKMIEELQKSGKKKLQPSSLEENTED